MNENDTVTMEDVFVTPHQEHHPPEVSFKVSHILADATLQETEIKVKGNTMSECLSAFEHLLARAQQHNEGHKKDPML